jgi:hypothetical protein
MANQYFLDHQDLGEIHHGKLFEKVVEIRPFEQTQKGLYLHV